MTPPASTKAVLGVGERKGGYDATTWMWRYADRMADAGYTQYEAECAALNAWEASPDDADPDDTAGDDLAYDAVTA